MCVGHGKDLTQHGHSHWQRRIVHENKLRDLLGCQAGSFGSGRPIRSLAGDSLRLISGELTHSARGKTTDLKELGGRADGHPCARGSCHGVVCAGSTCLVGGSMPRRGATFDFSLHPQPLFVTSSSTLLTFFAVAIRPLLHCYKKDDRRLAVTSKIGSLCQHSKTTLCLRIHLLSQTLTTNRESPITSTVTPRSCLLCLSIVSASFSDGHSLHSRDFPRHVVLATTPTPRSHKPSWTEAGAKRESQSGKARTPAPFFPQLSFPRQ